MSHPFLIKEIALQAGLGMASVDRLLNGRAHVREHAPRRVRQVIRELERGN
ncbi:LacI family DNA-binding transcriptional regulator [Paraburkholderia terrae]|uniref:LacI family DNA-binding transcriptional regulator n=1 Tax=Paraburkholderia terrae TaxID=311230 RepID=UPI00296A9F88|nr:LacI family DNA-binding transcriptional regulator [Paraburkholderia terrae]MDW3660711.1 LacI family DNA-binding transcriptional regulator [Paraburkholderia terrae]